MSQKQVATGVARRSGLSINVCMALLTGGWVYIEEIDKPARWERQF